MLTREQKQKIVKDLKEDFKKAKGIAFVDFSLLKVNEQRLLRKNLKANQAKLLLTKKTLIKKALGDLKIAFNTESIKGPFALIFSESDGVAPFRGANEARKLNPNLKILGGIFENKVLTLEEALQLASLLPRQELLAQLAWLIKSPLQRFVWVLDLYSQKKAMAQI